MQWAKFETQEREARVMATANSKLPTAEGMPTQIAGDLRNLIARGALAPGMRLGQSELAAQFQASRVPVREALKLLSSEGIVEHDPNRGFFVARLSSDEARQLFLMRDLIEDVLLATLPWPDARQLKEIRRRWAELEALLDLGDRSGWWTRHREFHNLIFDLSPQKVIVREAMRLWMLTDRFRAYLGMPRRDTEERRVIDKLNLVEALAEKDRDKLLLVRRERRHRFQELVLDTLGDRGL